METIDSYYIDFLWREQTLNTDLRVGDIFLVLIQSFLFFILFIYLGQLF